MPNGDRNENGKKIKRSNKQKKNKFARHSTPFCTFLCRCCCNVKLTSNTFYGENLSLCLQRIFFLCSCSTFSFSLSFAFSIFQICGHNN